MRQKEEFIPETVGKMLIPFGQDEDVRLYDPDVDCMPQEE